LQLKDSAFKSRRVALDIEAPKGTMGMFSPTRQEAEFVLARNSGYHITNIRFDQKDHRLVFEVRMGK
jgi:predicted RNA-binding protein associated with RNAse of E/G family